MEDSHFCKIFDNLEQNNPDNLIKASFAVFDGHAGKKNRSSSRTFRDNFN
jgi:hypothetical protein